MNKFIQLYEDVMKLNESSYGEDLLNLVDILHKEGYTVDSPDDDVAERVKEHFNLKSSTSHEAGLITAQVLRRLPKKKKLFSFL